MRARYMRQDEFEFTPVLKLLIIGNNKPGLSNVDDAARRRRASRVAQRQTEKDLTP